VLIAGLLWLLLISFFVGMWLVFGRLLTLLFVVGGVWLAQDYIRRGSFANADTVTRAGGWIGEHRSER
jgi:hypothetical protein